MAHTNLKEPLKTLQLPTTVVLPVARQLSEQLWRIKEPIAPATLVMDWSCVTEVDSSAVSFLLETQRFAHQHGIAVHHRKRTAALNRLLSLYDVTTLLPDDESFS